jgi:competence protein ComEC
MSARNISENKNHLSNIEADFDHYMVQVSDARDTSGNYCKFLADVKLTGKKGSWHISKGKILIYLPRSAIINYGDKLLIQGKPRRINPPLNPDEFNYQRFMRNNGILFQHFIKAGQFIRYENESRFSIYGLSLKVRNKISGIIHDRFSDRGTKSIMLALLTGQRNYIDQETYNIFISTGIIHTLAVSGLHVGIIYMFLLVLLKPLHRYGWSKKLSLIIKMAALLFFAFLTGLSASVMRATLMFLIMIAGKILNRNSPVLNSVFLSAFLLLGINPYLLFEIGFQLSYSAVIGILLFQPLLYNIMHSDYPIVNWIFQLVSVSIAAQLGTLPFSLFYFNQFPTYFLLGNIIAIPYVTISIITGSILIIISPVKFLSWILVLFLEFLSQLFITFISFIQSLPYGIIQPVHIDLSQHIILCSLIFSTFIMLYKKNRKIILFILLCISGIIGKDLYHKIKIQNDKKIIVYNVPNRTCIEFVDGREGIMLVHDLSEDLKSKINFHTINHIVRNKRDTEIITFSDIQRKFPGTYHERFLIFTWNGKSVVVMDKKCNLDVLKTISIDYLIVSKNAYKQKDLSGFNLNVKHMIWDSSNQEYMFGNHEPEPNRNRHHIRLHGPFVNLLN